MANRPLAVRGSFGMVRLPGAKPQPEATAPSRVRPAARRRCSFQLSAQLPEGDSRHRPIQERPEQTAGSAERPEHAPKRPGRPDGRLLESARIANALPKKGNRTSKIKSPVPL